MVYDLVLNTAQFWSWSGCFLGFDIAADTAEGVELRAGVSLLGLKCLTEGRFEGLVYH